MNFKEKAGMKIGGISGALVSLLLIYHGGRVFPELINTFLIAFLPWIGATLGDKYIK
ncbi:MAG: hypothetical protein HY550_03215 [Elusimicrobia bacterium]|nr:hypothetical protein [Elusimicrobiota bacterium]